jgi:hypothetical protein
MIKKIIVISAGFFILLITATYIHAASVDLAWDPPGDGGPVVGYMVYWSITSGSYDEVDSVEVVGETSATVTELDESKDHYFIVKAYNSAGIGPASNEALLNANSDSFYDDSPDTGSTESNGGGGGCFIATAAYGSALEYHVKILREFRDTYLMPTNLGRGFVKLYYQYSPALADVIVKHDSVRGLVRCGLAPVVGMAYVVLHTSSIEKSAVMLLMVLLATNYYIITYRRKRHTN